METIENKIITLQEDNADKINEKQNISNKENNSNANNKPNSNNLIQETLYEEYDSDNSALSNSDISENDIDSITKRTNNNKNMNLETFYKQSRQYFIRTEGEPQFIPDMEMK